MNRSKTTLTQQSDLTDNGPKSRFVETAIKRSRASTRGKSHQGALAYWGQWPRREDWPDILLPEEAAAYLRTSVDAIRDMCALDRKGQASLSHQRLPGKGSRLALRFRRSDLDHFGAVQQRSIL